MGKGFGFFSGLGKALSTGKKVTHAAGGKIKHKGGGYVKGTYRPKK